MWVEEGIVNVGGHNYRASKLQPIDAGNFDDFKLFGEYAVRRFPGIAKEIMLPPENFLSEIPEDDLDEIRTYAESRDSFPSWEAIQKDLASEVYHNFRIYMRWESKKGHLEKRTNPFTDEQLDFLEELIQPLKII